MRPILIASVLFLAGCSSAPRSTAGRPAPVEPSSAVTGAEPVAVAVIDGDTIDVAVGGTTERVRLIGINAPESGECFADEATAALAAIIEGQVLRLEADTSDRDAYGRLLRFVWVDGRGRVDGHERSTVPSVNERLVLDGFAIARRYEPDTALAERLEAAQAEAQRRGRGLWDPDACTGDGAGAVSDTDRASISIVALEPDAPGDDNLNLNGEWVRIVNRGPTTVDLTGWALKDESSSHRFSFPAGFTLAPSDEITIHSGCATDPMPGAAADTASVLHWCATGSAIWNNGGDTAFLLDPEGNIVDSFGY